MGDSGDYWREHKAHRRRVKQRAWEKELAAPRMQQPKDAPRVSTNAADDPDAPQRGVNAGETE